MSDLEELNTRDDSRNGNLLTIESLDTFTEGNLSDKVNKLISISEVVVFSKKFCPFSIDVIDLLTNTIEVPTTVVQIDRIRDGSKIHAVIKEQVNHKTVPAVFIKGEFIGGCDQVKSLHAKGKLTEKINIHSKVVAGDVLDTAKLVTPPRGKAVHALFWFPPTVNDYVVRVVGCQVFSLSVISAVFHEEEIAKWIAVFILIDFVTRFTVGSSLSVLGMIATVLTAHWKPSFKPGPPKQFASFCGVMFSTVSVCCFFTGHELWGAVVIAMLAGAAGLEGFVGFCLGCLFYSWGIRFGLIPDHVYRIYTSSRQETVDSWDYLNVETKRNAVAPTTVTAGPSKIDLKYKQKTDDWTLSDFHLVRNMQVGYFAMPLALSGLAAAFKLSSDWVRDFVDVPSENKTFLEDTYWKVASLISAAVFVVMLVLYTIRYLMYSGKCATEWGCPLRGPLFGTITITTMMLAFLLDDVHNDETIADDYSGVSRFFFIAGAVMHTALTIMKGGEWIGRRLELEHVHATWIVLPVGLAVASFCLPVLYSGDIDGPLDDIILAARFFYGFASLMWVALFTITFFKAVTTHNSDDRIRHSLSTWIAAPCVLGMAEYFICTTTAAFDVADGTEQCKGAFVQNYFIGIMFFFIFAWASMPHINFFGRDKFNMNYWTECFALDTLAAASAIFHIIVDDNEKSGFFFVFLAIAVIANIIAFMHTLASIIRRRSVFTPEVKWGPLSFMKLTHEAFRGAIPKLSDALTALDVLDDLGIKEFAALFSQFSVVHEEHAKAEDKVIFKEFNDYFKDHAKKWNDDHSEDHQKMMKWHETINVLLGHKDKSAKAEALRDLKAELPGFFDHFLGHMRGEEDNLQPIGRKHLPLEVTKQISRAVFHLSSAEMLEVILPFVVNNVPRQQQRVRYLKCLCWSLPERSQQIGAIIYRNVDAVMWERIRVEIPEIVPRGEYNWRRYY